MPQLPSALEGVAVLSSGLRHTSSRIREKRHTLSCVNVTIELCLLGCDRNRPRDSPRPAGLALHVVERTHTRRASPDDRGDSRGTASTKTRRTQPTGPVGPTGSPHHAHTVLTFRKTHASEVLTITRRLGGPAAHASRELSLTALHLPPAPPNPRASSKRTKASEHAQHSETCDFFARRLLQTITSRGANV